jgi:hypothetical protein
MYIYEVGWLPAIYACVHLAVKELAGIKRKSYSYLGIFDS